MIADPVFGPLVGETVKRLSGGREDFGIVVIIASSEGLSMINSLPRREILEDVLRDALEKASTTDADAHHNGTALQ